MNVERALAEAPDPALARTAWERVIANRDAREILDRPMVAPVAIRVLGFSPAAADFLVRYPDEAAVFAMVGPRTRQHLDLEVSADIERHGPAAGLRRFRRRAMLRVAARDLGRRLARRGRPRDHATSPTPASRRPCLAVAGGDTLAVIALGKWGGRELNYSSDVDLLFVHERSEPNENEAAERAAASCCGCCPSRPPTASRSASTRRCAPAAAPARSSVRSRPRSPTTSAAPPPGSARR